MTVAASGGAGLGVVRGRARVAGPRRRADGTPRSRSSRRAGSGHAGAVRGRDRRPRAADPRPSGSARPGGSTSSRPTGRRVRGSVGQPVERDDQPCERECPMADAGRSSIRQMCAWSTPGQPGELALGRPASQSPVAQPGAEHPHRPLVPAVRVSPHAVHPASHRLMRTHVAPAVAARGHNDDTTLMTRQSSRRAGVGARPGSPR